MKDSKETITLNDLVEYKERLLMRKLLVMVIVVNLIVVISIIVCT
jgi:hypothetical protein